MTDLTKQINDSIAALNKLRTAGNREPMQIVSGVTEAVEERLGSVPEQLVPYVKAPNSDDHLMLVALPMVMDEITDILFRDEFFDAMLPWYKSEGFEERDAVRGVKSKACKAYARQRAQEAIEKARKLVAAESY